MISMGAMLPVLVLAAQQEQDKLARSQDTCLSQPSRPVAVQIPELNMDAVYAGSEDAFAQEILQLEQPADVKSIEFGQPVINADMQLDPKLLLEQTEIYHANVQRALAQQQQQRLQRRAPYFQEVLNRQASEEAESNNAAKHKVQLADDSNSVSIINTSVFDFTTGLASTVDPEQALANLSQKQARLHHEQAVETMPANEHDSSKAYAKLNKSVVSNNEQQLSQAQLATAKQTTLASGKERTLNYQMLAVIPKVYPSMPRHMGSEAYLSQPNLNMGVRYYNLSQSNASLMAQALAHAKRTQHNNTFVPLNAWSNPFMTQVLSNHEQQKPQSQIASPSDVWSAQDYHFASNHALYPTSRQLVAVLNAQGRTLVSTLTSGSMSHEVTTAVMDHTVTSVAHSHVSMTSDTSYPVATLNEVHVDNTVSSALAVAARTTSINTVTQQLTHNVAVDSNVVTVSTLDNADSSLSNVASSTVSSTAATVSNDLANNATNSNLVASLSMANNANVADLASVDNTNSASLVADQGNVGLDGSLANNLTDQVQSSLDDLASDSEINASSEDSSVLVDGSNSSILQEPSTDAAITDASQDASLANNATTATNNSSEQESATPEDSSDESLKETAENEDNLQDSSLATTTEQDSTLAATTESSLNNNKAETNVSSSALASIDKKPEQAPSSIEVMSEKLEKASRLGLYGGGAQAALMAGQTTIDLIYSRMGVRNMPDTSRPYVAQAEHGGLGQDAYGLQVWVSPVYRHRDATSLQFNNASYGADINLYGLAVGADYTLESGGYWGLMFNSGQGDATGTGASSGISNDFDYYSAALYGGYKFKNWSVIGDVTYTKVDNQFDSVAEFSHVAASMDSEHLSVGVTTQYEFQLSPRVSVAPHVGLRYNSIMLTDYNLQELADNISYDMENLNFVAMPVGVTLTHTWQSADWLVQPAFDVTLTANVLDDSIQGDIIWDGKRRYRLPVQTQVIDRLSYRASVGVIASSTNGFSFNLNLNYTGAANTNEYGLSASLRWLF